MHLSVRLNTYSLTNRPLAMAQLTIALTLVGFGALAPSSRAETIVVDTIDGGSETRGLDCTLVDAITAANSDTETGGCIAGDGIDTIDFSVTGTIELESSLPTITAHLTIEGPGTGSLTIHGMDAYALLDADTVDLTVNDLTLQAGYRSTGGCLYAEDATVYLTDVAFVGCSTSSGDGGGAALESTTATLTRVFFQNNDSADDGGALEVFVSEVTVSDSTFAGNTAVGDGGAIYGGGVDTTIDIVRSTFSANKADGSGGAISIVSSAVTWSLTSSTVVDNEADLDASGGHNGGGIKNAGVFTITNSIVADNTDHSASFHYPNLYSSSSTPTITSGGRNLIGDNTGISTVFAAGAPNANLDLVGDSSDPIDPMLRSLTNNGGATPTHLPDYGSPVLDQGSCGSETEDQRGVTRPIDLGDHSNADDGCDIGAVEFDLIFDDGFESGGPSNWS